MRRTEWVERALTELRDGLDQRGLAIGPDRRTALRQGPLLLVALLVLGVTRLSLLPLQAVTLDRAPAHLTTAQIEDAARRAVNGNFLTTDIERARVACPVQAIRVEDPERGA